MDRPVGAQVTGSAGTGLTEPQRERRSRMRGAAIELAVEGGWDGVQMREVAARSQVALGTLYRYFPSKEYLLVSVMLDEIGELAERLSVRPPEGDDPVDRVVDVLRRANRALQREPQVTVAMIRALVTGDEVVAPVVAGVREAMRGIISEALGAPAAAQRVLEIDLLGDVWLASLVSWISGVEPASSVVAKLESATRVLLG